MTRSAAVTIAVIVVNYNAGKHLSRCLRSLAVQTRKPDRILVVDNCSSDNSIAACYVDFPGVEVIRLTANTGFATGNNLGADSVADCSWIALLNPDAFAEPDWVQQLHSGIERFPEYDVFACRLLWDHDPNLLDGAGDAYRRDGAAWPRLHHQRVGTDRDEPYEVFGACGAATLINTHAFKSAGGFDSTFFCYYEDVDLAFRLRLYGTRCLYLPHAVVRHIGSAISGSGSDFSVYYAHRNMVWVYVKNMPSPHFWLYLPFHIGLNLASVLVFIVRGRAALILRAKRDAFLGLRHALGQRRQIQSRRVVTARDVVRSMESGNAVRTLIRRALRR